MAGDKLPITQPHITQGMYTAFRVQKGPTHVPETIFNKSQGPSPESNNDAKVI